MFPVRQTHFITTLALALAVWSAYSLESARSSMTIDLVMLNETLATFCKVGQPNEALIVVAHEFGGSRQMLEAILLTLARAGHTIFAFDFLGLRRCYASLTGNRDADRHHARSG